ncbi:MAG: CHAT domain-containing protein [Candidatus Aminicenantes bacterium]|nr:CHAT domain-containing protein [Candidatus Aminicenantes bacterium]
MADYRKAILAALLALAVGAGSRTAGAKPGRPTAILEYRLGETDSRVLLHSGNRTWTAVLPSERSIERSVSGFIRESGRPTGDIKALDRAAVRIAGEIIPFRRELENMDAFRLIVVPDGVLNELPFEALRFGEHMARLVERFALSYSSSARTAGSRERNNRTACVSRIPKIGLLSTEGARLPGADREIAGISGLFAGTGSGVCTGRFVIERFSGRSGKGCRVVLHFAGHAGPQAGGRDRNALVLRVEAGEAGLLFPEEIRRAGIAAELVVLSACRTAGDLSRSFLEAGARSVVATLWPVADRPSSRLVAAFYRRLRAGREKAEALREAKLEMIRGGHVHPFSWAGFILQGDPGGAISFR